VINALNTPRSVILIVRNQTDAEFSRVADSHAHGRFSTPPAPHIPPGKAAVFGSVSADWSVGTGTEGTVTYVGQGVRVTVNWDNPFVGDNSCGSSLDHTLPTRIRVDSACGGGNQNAQMTYSIHLVPRELFPGCARDIAVGGDGGVWVVGCNVNEFPSGGNIRRWAGAGWGPVAGHGLRIAAGPAGTVWAVQKNGAIQHYLGGTKWDQVPGCGRDIAVGGDGSVWVVGCNIDEFPSGGNIRRLQGKQWGPVVGHGLRIAGGPGGVLWAVQKNGAIQRYLGGTKWEQVHGCGKDIAVGGDGTVWLIGCNTVGPSGTSINKLVGNNWTRVEGASSDISAGPNGEPWTVNLRGEIAHFLLE
jgi:hypothetical protein